ncbi:MAG TPA: hypothetical protein VJ904_00735, partial [Tichowtungia sp.]|nr:hypothetical protein [Tichowtungia sp.]
MGGRAINSKVISEVLLRLYESRADGDFYEHVLELLEDNIPYVVSGYAFTYPADQRFDERLVRNGNRVSRPSVPDLDRLVGMHPFFPVYLNNNMGPVICTTDLMSAEEWKRTEIYNELHRKYGVVHDTSIRFYDQHKCISFCFSDQRPMDAEHRRLLNLVAPHLATAYRSFRLQQNGLAELLPAHMVLLNSAGRPQILSPAAEDCFGRYLPRGKRCSGGRLPAELEEWVQHELSAAAKGSAPEPMVIRNRNGAVVFRLTRFADGWVLSMDDMAPPR